MEQLKAEYRESRAKFKGVQGRDVISNFIRKNAFEKAKKILYQIRDLERKFKRRDVRTA